jgi:hypothetical protein
MTEAIELGDVDRVLRLREVVAVRLPSDVDQSRLALAEARLNAVKPLVESPRSRAKVLDEAAAKALQALMDAKSALEAAAEVAETASRDAQFPNAAAAACTSRIAALSKERDRVAESAATGQRARLHALAGLAPEGTTQPEVEERGVQNVDGFSLSASKDLR